MGDIDLDIDIGIKKNIDLDIDLDLDFLGGKLLISILILKFLFGKILILILIQNLILSHLCNILGELRSLEADLSRQTFTKRLMSQLMHV